MKTKGEIVQKYKQRRYRHLAKVLKQNLSRRGVNCLHNAPHKDANGNVLHYCWYGQESPGPFTGVVCDDRLDGGHQVKGCPLFTPVPKGTLVSVFETSLNNPELLVSQYPDLAALQWVLGESVKLSWFDKLRNFLLVTVKYVFRNFPSKSQETTPPPSDPY